mmetsp:Transcript_48742/g.93250  ORF Transcript_48742/g.93250 Transcript_48742/m.93250 type:complete len:99 (-) Transcript_48742:591-887(-)
MSPEDPLGSMVMSSIVVCAIKENPLYNMFMVLQSDLKDVDFDELEQRSMDYYYEHVHQMEDNQQLGPKMLMTSDVSVAVDIAFVVGASHHPCRFCTNG